MATERQIEANRLNALKSTGPKTPEGRAAVALNGVKHGITARTLVLKGESEEDFTLLLDSYEAEHDPATPTEEALVQQLAMATWRLRRLYRAEAAFASHKLNLIAETETGRKLDDAGRLGLVTDRSQDTMATFSREESRLERSFYRALHELQRLRKDRQPKLALVSQKAPAIESAPPDCPEPAAVPQSALQNPAAAADPDPETTIHLVPQAPDMS